MSIEQALEMARCAEVNLNNVVGLIPLAKVHPLFEVVKNQIKECIKELEKEDSK